MDQISFLNPSFWLMPNRSYVHPSYEMNFYWKLRIDCFATTFIFDEMQSFLPKEGMSWKKFVSLMTWSRNCSFGPQSYTSSFTTGPWTFLSSSIRRSSHSLHEHEVPFCLITKAMLILWYLRDLSSFVPSRCESYDHLRVSYHRCPLGWLFVVILIIISLHGS